MPKASEASARWRRWTTTPRPDGIAEQACGRCGFAIDGTAHEKVGACLTTVTAALAATRHELRTLQVKELDLVQVQLELLREHSDNIMRRAAAARAAHGTPGSYGP